MKAKDLDKKFDAGEEISKYLDLSRAKRVNEAPQTRECGLPCMDDSFLGQGSEPAGRYPAVHYQGLDLRATGTAVVEDAARYQSYVREALQKTMRVNDERA